MVVATRASVASLVEVCCDSVVCIGPLLSQRGSNGSANEGSDGEEVHDDDLEV